MDIYKNEENRYWEGIVIRDIIQEQQVLLILNLQ